MDDEKCFYLASNKYSEGQTVEAYIGFEKFEELGP